MTNERFSVEHHPEETRYVLIDRGEGGTDGKIIGEERYLDAVGDERPERILYHTEVSNDYGGQGLASVLVRAVVDDSIDAGRAVVPVCPYVVAWLPKHPEYADHVIQPTPKHLQELSARL